MYRLKIIAGPNSGKSYPLAAASISIGRQSSNGIVLGSENVSKRHCLVLVKDEEVTVKDQGSANGTFVNGVLAKEKKLRLGDRLSVGGIVLELKRIKSAQGRARPGHDALPASMLANNVVPFPGQRLPATAEPAGLPAPQVPTDAKGKAVWYFEAYIMPFFYNMNLRQDWKLVCTLIFGVFLILDLVISVYPLVDQNRQMVLKEASLRAQFIARQLVERNSAALASKAESRVEIGTLDRDDAVTAYLVDLDNRIIAPTNQVNQYLVSGPEAPYATKVAQLFKGGRETGFVGTVGDTIVTSIEPVKVYDGRTGRNTVIAMAVVTVDAATSIPTGGGLSLIFSESFILAALLGMLTLYLLYRVTLKPFEILNEDIDRVLKGESSQITQEFKTEELNPLWDVIRSALQRMPKSATGFGGEEPGVLAGIAFQDMEPIFRALSDIGEKGVVLCDRECRVTFLNEFFEEISGFRSADAIGREFASLARDEGLGALIKDLFERVRNGGSAQEDVDFSGTTYRIVAFGIGAVQAQGYFFWIAKGGA